MRFGSVCSGIEAASVAWHPLGWRASFLSEIEAFPRAVLSHHYPEVPLHGDFTTIRAGEYDPIDLLVGGTPCQSFSVAGLRGGLDDDRGNLALEYLRLADRLRPRWLVWENVPGVLSSNGGRDFGAILGGMVELGYGFAYRVLDAQFLGVAQRRRRVFVVGHLGDWRRAAAVLFERHSLSGHPAPRREARKDLAPTISARPTGGGGLGTDFDLDGGLVQAFGGNRTSGPVDVASALSAHGGPHGRMDFASETFGTHAIQAGALRENPASGPDGVGVQEGCAYTLEARSEVQAVAYRVAGDGAAYYEGDATAPLTTGTDSSASIVAFDTTQITSAANYSNPQPGDPCHPLASGAHAPCIAYPINPNALRGDSHAKTPSMDAAGVVRLRDPGLGVGADGDPADTLQAAGPGAVAFTTEQTPKFATDMALTLTKQSPTGGGQPQCVMASSAVRRLTPRECERLQGFPDDYTLIPYRKGMAADGPRYKALGNSMAVPVMRWIGERIAQVDAIPQAQIERSAA